MGYAAIGTFVAGMSRKFGEGISYGASFGIQDFSVKQADQFGQSVLIERAFAKRARVSLLVQKEQSDQLFYLLTQRRARPTLYITTDEYEAGAIFGKYNTFEQLIPYPNETVFELDFEALA